jgi:DNA repair protein RecO (recombination protein O)
VPSTSTQPAFRDDAIVLRSVDYGEADRVITLLTAAHGRVSALARAARKSKRRFAGSLEGFAWIEVELQFGRGSLGHLQSARVTRTFPKLLTDLARLNAAGAVLRLGRDLIPDELADPDVFEAMREMLVELDRGEVPAEPYQLAFEARLLGLCGFAPLLAACGACGKIPPEGRVAAFDPARGCIVCSACGGAPERIHAPVRERLMRAIDGDVSGAASEPWQAGELREGQRLLDAFASHRLGKPR